MRCASRTFEIAVALLLPCAAASAGPRVTIALQPHVQVSGDTVLLGQVAHMRSADLALMRRLVDLPLGRAPQSGQQAIVRRGSLATWIAQEAGLQAAEIDWQSADAVHVQRARTVVAGGDILKEARAALHAKLVQEGGGSVQIDSRVLPRDVEVEAGEVTLRVKPIQGASMRNRMVVWVEVWVSARFRRAIPVSLEVESVSTPGRAAGPLQYVPGAQALRAAVDEERRTDVTRGDWAVLRTFAGAVMLESRVEVLQDGRVGDRVRVRQGGATGIVLARVTGPAALEVAP